MAQIDSNVYFQQQAPNIVGSYQQGLQLRDMIDQRDLQSKQLKKQDAIDQAQNAGVKVNPDGTVSQDIGMTTKKLVEGGYGAEALKAQNQFSAEETAKQKAQAEKQLQQMDLWGRLFGPANDQASWDKALADAPKFGISTDGISRAFDPGLKQSYLQRTLSAKDQLEQQWKQKEFGLKQQEFNMKKGSGEARFGKAPPGYRFKQDGSLEPIPGGPAAGKEEKRVAMEQQQAGLVVQDLGRALKMTSAAGPVAGQLSYVPGTKAWELDQMLDSVKANVGFDKLQAMRAASPTGGALGGISNQEMAMLQATAGKLDPRLPQEVLEDNLKRLTNQYNDIVHGPGNGPKRLKLSFDDQGNPLPQKNIVMKAPSGREMRVPERNVQEAKSYGAVVKGSEIDWAD